jgi:hypothetical protein
MAQTHHAEVLINVPFGKYIFITELIFWLIKEGSFTVKFANTFAWFSCTSRGINSAERNNIDISSPW